MSLLDQPCVVPGVTLEQEHDVATVPFDIDCDEPDHAPLHEHGQRLPGASAPRHPALRRIDLVETEADLQGLFPSRKPEFHRRLGGYEHVDGVAVDDADDTAATLDPLPGRLHSSRGRATGNCDQHDHHQRNQAPHPIEHGRRIAVLPTATASGVDDVPDHASGARRTDRTFALALIAARIRR